MDNPTWNDAQLVYASRQGNQQAFATLVDRYKGLVAAIAYSSTCDPILSQDLAQETFTVAWRKLNEINDPDRFRPWLCGVVRHLIQQALRERKRTSQHILRSRETAITTQASPPTPCDAAVAREQSETVARALARLPEEYRLPLVLYYYEGQSSRLVAKALGITVEAARQRLVRGRQQLREELLKLVDTTLERQRPRQAFVVAVLTGLTKTPIAPVALTKFSLSAKAVAAASLVAAGLLAIWGITSTARIDAGANPPPTQLEKNQAVASIATETSPPPAATQTGPVSIPAQAPAPQTDAHDADAISLAASILDKAWETQPMPAARILCVEAWGYRAALGDPACRVRLLREAGDPASEQWGSRSAQMLTAVLYETDYLKDIYLRCANPTLPERTRVGYFGALYWSIAFLNCQGKPVPASATDAAVEMVEKYGPSHLMMDFIQKTATERARAMAEYYLLASVDGAATPFHPPSSGTGFSTVRGPAVSQGSYYDGICLADRCLSILERIGNPASCEVVREYLASGGDIDRPYAAVVLGMLGDREPGVAVLTKLLESADDPIERIHYQSSLVQVGEKHYLDSIKQALLDGNPDIRMAAYCALCRHDDQAFIQPAVRDFKQYGSNGFWQILRASPEILRVTKAGVHTGYNAAFTEFCIALATHPDARAPQDGLAAAMSEQGLSALMDSEQAPLAVGACMPALTMRFSSFQTYLMREMWVRKLVYLLRWGDAETRIQAAQRLTEGCRANMEIEEAAVFDLKWAANPEAGPLLIEIMQSSPSENHRVLAAVAYLAIRSGKRL